MALSQAIQTIHTHHPNHQCLTTLVAESGGENNNQTIEELMYLIPLIVKQINLKTGVYPCSLTLMFKYLYINKN
jgi:hypothetical protein